jgi:hypothetical protein
MPNRNWNHIATPDGDTHEINLAYIMGAKTARGQEAEYSRPYHDRNDPAAWDAGKANELAGLHVVDGVDVITASPSGICFGGEPQQAPVVERPGGKLNIVRNGKDEAIVTLEIKEEDDRQMLKMHLQSDLATFSGKIMLQKGEDWRAVLAEMPAARFMEYFGLDRMKWKRCDAPVHVASTKTAFLSVAFGSRGHNITEETQEEAQKYVLNALSFLEKNDPEMEKIFIERVKELSRDYPPLANLSEEVVRATPEEMICFKRIWVPFQEDLKAELEHENAPAGPTA